MRQGFIVMLTLAVLATAGVAVAADEVGRVKVVKGGGSLPAAVGMALQEGDVVVTARDGSAGVTFNDDSLLSVGPDSALAIDRFAFDSTTHAGRFDTSLRRGTLSAVSGKIARQSPDAMKVRTPSTILGVRGTEFVVRAVPVAPERSHAPRARGSGAGRVGRGLRLGAGRAAGTGAARPRRAGGAPARA
jgi:hypothetical protein